MRGRTSITVLLVVLAGGALGAWWWLSGGPAQQSAPVATSAGAVARPDLGRRVRVEVLNAGGKRGVARGAMELLRRDGFDVVYFGNADTFDQDSSVVLDRVGHLDLARAVANALGIRIVRSEPDPNLYLDVTVRLGSEWLPPRAAAGKGRRSPWDLRRWLGR